VHTADVWDDPEQVAGLEPVLSLIVTAGILTIPAAPEPGRRFMVKVVFFFTES
jgi:hypothetical protein